MDKYKIRFITFAWGHDYVDHMLSFNLPAALSPGNLPCIADEFDLECVILTESRFFDVVRQHPTCAQLQKIGEFRLVSIDDLISYQYSYGLTLTQTLFRGFSDLGPAMTETTLLFLNADFILAENSYRNLLPKLRAGERLLLSPSYCTTAETVMPQLHERRDERSWTLSIPHRELASLILDNRHNTIKGKTVNQRLFSMDFIEQFYWRVDDHTLICRQMPFSLVGMRPEKELTELRTIWDYGIISEACPTASPCIMSDSDDFLILELRDGKEHFEKLTPGWPTPKSIAKRLGKFMTEDQRRLGEYTLVLHSQDLPPGLEAAKGELAQYVDHVFKLLPDELTGHYEHPQWVYHHGLFEAYRAKALNGNAAPPPMETPSFLRRSIASLKQALFGRYPFVTSLHPYWPDVRLVERALAEITVKPDDRVLIISSEPTGAFQLVPETAKRVELPLKECSNAKRTESRLNGSTFDFCFIDVFYRDIADAAAAIAVVKDHLVESGAIVGSVKSPDQTGIGRDRLLEFLGSLDGFGATNVGFCGNQIHKLLGVVSNHEYRYMDRPKILCVFHKLLIYTILLVLYLAYLPFDNRYHSIFPGDYCFSAVFTLRKQ